MPDDAFPTDVSIAVKWLESGQQVPQRTAAALQDLDRAGSSAAVSFGDRMAQAFANMERREPTYVLRRVRFAIEEMAASSVGASGPLGRMVASLGMLEGGGPVAFGAVAGLAGIAVGMRALIDLSDKLEKGMRDASDAIAALGGAGAAMWEKLGQMRDQSTDLGKPTLAMQAVIAASGIGGFIPGADWAGRQVLGGMTTGQQSKGASLWVGEVLQFDKIAKDHLRLITEHNRKIEEGIQADIREWEKGVRSNREHQAELARLQREHLAQIRQNNERIERLQDEDRQEWERSVRQGRSVRGTVDDPRLIAISMMGGLGGFFGVMGTREELQRGKKFQDELDERAKKGDRLETHDLERIISASFGAVAAVRGGVSGALAGAGGLASTLGGLTHLVDGKSVPLLGAGAAGVLGPLGAALSGFGALTSLFGHHHQSVRIESFSDRALAQWKSVSTVPNAFSVNIVGPTPATRTTQYDLGRLTARDASPRLYG